jgi:hypothetical protein
LCFYRFHHFRPKWVGSGGDGGVGWGEQCKSVQRSRPARNTRKVVICTQKCSQRSKTEIAKFIYREYWTLERRKECYYHKRINQCRLLKRSAVQNKSSVCQLINYKVLHINFKTCGSKVFTRAKNVTDLASCQGDYWNENSVKA